MPRARLPRRAAVALVALALHASPLHAAHPLISEDTGTQGAGKFELELGTQTSHVEGSRVGELDPQLSYGVLDNLDAILRPSFFRLNGAAADAASRRQGFGSTALDVKWRAVERLPWSFGTRAGFDLPTASGGLGPHEPGAHALVMATYDAAPLLATANLAYTRIPRDVADELQRRDVFRVSTGALLELNEVVRLAGDVALVQAPHTDERRWSAVGLIGAIVRTPWGFDVDAGWQFPVNRPAPSSVWLLGATVRW
jgi:hypothetical protein